MGDRRGEVTDCFEMARDYQCLYKDCTLRGPAHLVIVMRSKIPNTDLERQAHVPVHAECLGHVFKMELITDSLKGAKRP